jgi:hypothetical protein
LFLQACVRLVSLPFNQRGKIRVGASSGISRLAEARRRQISPYGVASRLWRADELIGSRADQVEEILDAIGDIPGGS